MKVSLQYLYGELLNNVCEVAFPRRRRAIYGGPVRRMLCTNSAALLNSYNGKMVFNYYVGTHPLPYDPFSKNLIVTWDCIMCDYRQIPMDNCTLLQQWPANDEFWKYFNENVLVMSTAQKMQYMDY